MDHSLSNFELSESTVKLETGSENGSSSDKSDPIEILGYGDVESSSNKSDDDFDNNLPETVTLLKHERTGAKVYLIGTAHFSKESQEDVLKVITNVVPHVVVLELCSSRANILSLDEATVLEEAKNIDMQKIISTIRTNGVYNGLMYLLLLNMSAHLTKEIGMAPGGEFRVAYTEASKIPHCGVHLGDRPINITLQRALARLTWFQTVKLAWHLLTSKDSVSVEEIEKCKNRDMLEQLLADLAGEYPAFREVFLDERDIYLTNSLQAAALSKLKPRGHEDDPVDWGARERRDAERQSDFSRRVVVQFAILSERQRFFCCQIRMVPTIMDIDRISYIFGSFARRRQSHDAIAAKRRSMDSPKKIHHDRSKSAPHQSKKQATMVAPRAKSVVVPGPEEMKLKCPMCKNQFNDPRVLPCLHTFCLKCLQELEKRDFTVWYDDDSDASAQRTDSSSSRKASSGGSGYASDTRQEDFSPGKTIRCPTCAVEIELPPVGVAIFPPNYPLQHKIVLAAINSRSTHLLCDLCTSDVSAVARCMECALSFCRLCEEVHLRQKSSAEHQVLGLDEARDRGITRVRKQIMCMSHPELELTVFCSSCYQVVCRDCMATSHRGHLIEPLTRAANIHFAKLRMAADRAKSVVEESALAASKLTATSKKIEAQCTRVQNEVERFIEEYVRSVEEHKMNLLEQIKEVREEKLHSISEEKVKLQRRIKDARDVAYFLDDLLNDDGTDVEVLSFLNPVLCKIKKCNNFEPVQDLKVSGSLQFLKEESVKCPNNFFTVYGVLTTQSVSPEHCHLNVEGLQNLRIGKKVEVILETKDADDAPIERGGEEITAEIRHREAGVSRSLAANVIDRRDGTYAICFVPDMAGKLILSVHARGQPISGSPFAFTVRTVKPHIGTFHCCTFCSSGGSKEATCSCEGTMPGGYKGCGHGHEGHPGRRHWSCCGSVLEHSECIRSNRSQYQITL